MKYNFFDKLTRFLSRVPCQYSENVVDRIKYVPNTEELEHCIICGSLTRVPISMPIDWRKNYEIGCGQICDKCAKEQCKATGGRIPLSNEQILQAVEQSRKENKE